MTGGIHKLVLIRHPWIEYILFLSRVKLRP